MGSVNEATPTAFRGDPGGVSADAVRACRIRLAYGARRVVDQLDLTVRQGSVTALCGPNGSGKSTLLEAFAGLRPPMGGEIEIEGVPLSRLNRRELARRVAYLPQQPRVPDGLDVREVVTLGRFPHRSRFGGAGPGDIRAVARAIEQAGVEHLGKRPMAELSGGERQRVWLALILAQEARILLLDEPTTFLDPQHQVGMLGRVRELATTLGLTVIWVLHDLNQAAAYSDRLALLHEGAIAAEGTPAGVLTEATVRRVFGLDTLIISHPESGDPLCVPRVSR